MNLDQLLVHIRCKQYSLATKEIGSSVLYTREALLVIYEIANTVMHRQVLSQEENRDFVSLLVAYKRRTAHMVKDYREKDTVKYYNCLHFIVKYISTEYLVELLELRELILLDREQVVHNKAAQVYYAGTYNLILKEVTKASHLTHRQRIELILLQLEMRLVVMEDFAKNIASLFHYFCQININTELQHNCLTTILTIIYPSECHADNLCYLSSILTVLQQICVKGLKSDDDYKIDLSLIILLMKKQCYIAKVGSSTAIIDILITLSLEAVDFLPQLYKALKIETFRKFGIQEMFFITKVYCFLIVWMQTWKSSTNTAHYISENATHFMKIIKLMNKHFLANMKVCQCCSMKLDPTNNLHLCSVAVDLLKHYKIFTPLIELYEPMFYISNELLLQMKSANCKDFNKHWSMCISLLNNIGIEMISNNQTGGETFLQLLLKLIGKFGLGSNNFSKSNLQFILKLISFYINQKDYKLTVLFTAIAVYLDVVNFDKVFQPYQYAVYKLNLSLSEREHICGIPHILNQNIEAAKKYIPTLGDQVDNSRTEEILLLELNAYLTKGQSMSAVVNLLKQLAKCSDSTRISPIIQKHYKIFAYLDYDMVTIFQNLLQDCKSSNLCSAVLNYLIAKNFTHRLIQLNKIDINNAPVPQEAVTSQFEPAPDPNDTCDIVSTYSGLSLNNHKTILAYLKSSLDDIKECYDNIEATSELEMSFDLCSKLAHSFRLQCNFIYSESAWILAKRIAAKLQDNLKLLEAIGWLLNKADLNEGTKQLLAEGNAISNELPPNGLQLSWYHLHICYFHLMNCQWDSVIEEYHATRRCMLMWDFTTADKTGFTAHFAFLESMLSRMPCAVAIDKPHKPELLPKKALQMLVSFINSGTYTKVDAYHLTTYFEEIDDVLMRFSLMRLPREIRLHGRDAVTLAQKLILPMRTARILTHLAKADILSCNMNDCQMKLDGIANILDLPVLKYKPRNVRATEDLEDNDDLDCKLVEQFREMGLHVPKTSSISGSPTLRRRFYNIPMYTNHVISCDCFECTTPEYTILILGKLHIDFLLSESQLDPAMSDVTHEMALKVYNYLSIREKAFEKIVTTDYKRVGNETYAHFLLDFVLKLGIIRYNLHKAIENNNKIFDLLKDNRRYESNLLLCEAKVQRYLLLMHQKSLNILETDDILNDESEFVLNVLNDDKTPERKVNLSKTIKNELVRPERLKINIPFHLSDDDDDNQSMKQPNAITNKNKSPVPKFKVFDAATSKSKSSQHSTRSSTNKSAKVDLNTAFHCPSSSSTSKVKERTAKKTKILTEKLKRSAKKQYDTDSDDKKVEPKINNKNIRKNLMQELKDCHDTTKLNNAKCEDPDSNRVRRTTRRKN